MSMFSACVENKIQKLKPEHRKGNTQSRGRGGRRKGRRKGERGREGGTESILAPDSDSNFSWQNSRRLFRYIVPRKISI